MPQGKRPPNARELALRRIQYGQVGNMWTDEQLVLARGYMSKAAEVKRLKKRLRETEEGFKEYRNS